MANKRKNIQSKKRNLRSFLDEVVERSKRNNHSGEARSKDLENELNLIEKQIEQTLIDINEEVENDPSAEYSSKVTAKLERTTQLLTSELMRLSAIYHRQVDTARIRKFLNQQQEIIRTSMDDGADASLSLDDRVNDLHKLMATERQRVTKAEAMDRMKFTISLAIGLTSLCISIYALWIR